MKWLMQKKRKASSPAAAFTQFGMSHRIHFFDDG
jgi:hypothetical protein